jgi:hypothetical protein
MHLLPPPPPVKPVPYKTLCSLVVVGGDFSLKPIVQFMLSKEAKR